MEGKYRRGGIDYFIVTALLARSARCTGANRSRSLITHASSTLSRSVDRLGCALLVWVAASRRCCPEREMLTTLYVCSCARRGVAGAETRVISASGGSRASRGGVFAGSGLCSTAFTPCREMEWQNGGRSREVREAGMGVIIVGLLPRRL